MAKKRVPKMPAATAKKTPKRLGRPVRLDLSEELHERIQAQADKMGLNKASYVRVALMQKLRADEEGD
jgi:hypothetical protein